MQKKALHIIAILLLCLTFNVSAHDIHSHDNSAIRKWTLTNHKHLHASFLMMKNGEVYLEDEHGNTRHYPLSQLSATDQQFVKNKERKIAALNNQLSVVPVVVPYTETNSTLNYTLIVAVFSTFILLSIVLYVWLVNKRPKMVFGTVGLSLALLLFSFTQKPFIKIQSTTNPLFIDSAFVPFKPNVHTFWDNNYFYVESKGIPTTHNMMVGITAWQQQVPLPQCYIGSNAWSIPLNPVVADTPVPVSPAHFSRGAIAIAVNGVPIFNPYTNTGVDAYLDGQLDNWGGHSGRADDYHYHTAPLHLYGSTANTLPIAFALDGFAVYGSYEPDGSAMQPLDANHGHYGGNGVYHYHGSAGAPYMIANMVGQITEDTTHQIIPQPHAQPVRPSLTPLSGAVITGFAANGPNGYILTYTRQGQTYKVSYSWTNNGQYTYSFISPTDTVSNNYNGFQQCEVPLGITETMAGKLVAIYPNPATDVVNINISKPLVESEVNSIAMYTLGGKLVYQTQGYKKAINVSGLSAGMYMIKVDMGNTSTIKKIVIE